MNMKKMIGALTAKFAVALMAFSCISGAWALTVDVNDTSIELPAMQATLLDPADENFPNNNLNELTIPLNHAVHFALPLTAAQRTALDGYYFVDFVLTLNKDVLLVDPTAIMPQIQSGALTIEEAAAMPAGCIVGATNPDNPWWIAVPMNGQKQLSANTAYKVCSELGGGGLSLPISETQCLWGINECGFDCGIWFTPGFLAANPDLVITLEPRLYKYNTADQDNPFDMGSLGNALRFPPAAARIGNTYYGSLSEAVAAVPTDGTETTITMVADETISGNTGVTIAAGKNVVLDLAGHTVELAVASTSQAFLIQNNGTLTVNDSATGGRLYTNGEGKGGNNTKGVILNFGQLTVNGGTIAAKSTNSAGAAYGAANAIQCQRPTADVSIAINGGTLTAEGGTVMSIMTSSAVYMLLNSVSSTAAFTMTGGTLIASGSEMCSAVNVYLQNNDALQASVNISGGELRGVKEALYVHGGTTLDYQGVVTTITGGTFTGFYDAEQTTEFALNVRAGLLNVTDGTFNYGSYIGAHKIDISGGNFTEDVILYRDGGSAVAKVSGGSFGSVVTSGTAGNLTVNGDANLYNQKKYIYGGTFKADPTARVADGCVAIEDNGVWVVGKVKTTELEQKGEVTETAATYAVTAVVKTNDVEVANSTTTVQEIAVRVAEEGNVADATLAKFEMGEVLSKAVASAGEDAASVTKVEILVNASTEAAGQVQSITYDVRPEAVVTVSKAGEADTTSTVELSNTDLAADAEFTFELDVSSLAGIAVGDQVRVTHSWDAYTDAAGNSVAAGSETTLATVIAGLKVRITTTHFSSWTLEGIDVANTTVAIVFAANGSEIDQYDSVAGAISANSTVNGCTVLVLDGTHDCGSSTITVNKAITITGQSKTGTVLNFAVNGLEAAFSVAASNVTIKDMTINQSGTGESYHVEVEAASADSCYSNVVMSNLILGGGHYSMIIYGESFTIDGCDFASQSSSQILIDATKGNSKITNNHFTGGKYNVLHRNSHSPTTVTSYGKLIITGNTSTNGNLLYILESAGSIDTTQKIELLIANNIATGYTNKAVGLCPTDELGKYLSSVTIISNVFYSAGQRALQRDDSTTSLEIDASYNYWGPNPDFTSTAVIRAKNNLSNPNVKYEPYYITYNSTTGELSDLRPLPAVAQFISSDGVTTNKCETLQAAFNDAKAAGGGKVELLSNVELSAPVALDPTAAQLSNGNGSFVFDGCGYTISPAADWTGSDHVLQLGWGGSGAQTAEDHAANIAAQSQVLTNLTISGFTIVGSVFRSEDVTVTVVDCTFSGNTATTPGNRPGSVLLFSHAAATATGCTFTGNTVDNVIDFNSQGGVGTNVGSGSVAVNNCLFNGNTCGSGVFYTTGCISKNVTISNSTFSGNSANASGAAMVYCSGTTTIEGCLFMNNTVTSTSKGGLVVLGSGASGTVISSNAFTSDNNLSGNAGKYGTVLVGSDCTANGNYWGDGQAPEAGSTNGSDIYLKDSPTVTASTYATAYAVNDNGRGVTVTLYVPPVATVTIGGVTTQYGDLHEALEAGKAKGAVVTLLKDVDLAGGSWTPVGDDATSFNGTFDGQNHIIRNLTGSGTTNVGLFGHAVGAAIRNVTISNVTFTASSSHVGALIGHGDCFTASNCVVIGTINISGSSNAGGLVGTASNAQWAFRDCLVDGTSANSSTVSSSNMVGGLAGNTDYEGVVVGCTVKNVTVSGPKKVGGLIGQLNYDNDANHNDTSDLVSVSGTKVESVIVNCTATAQTDDYVQVGGLFGILYRDNTKSDFASVSITATVKNVTVNGIEASTKGASNAGIVSGGYRKKTVADSQTQLAGDNVVFHITFEGTNAVTGNTNYSDYIGIYNPAPYVAQINGQGYLTFAAAITAAEEYAATHDGEYPTITVLDDTAEIGNDDWKIADGKLVKKNYVAQIGANKYESLRAAIEAVPTTGTATTITMIDDSAEATDITITIAATKNIVLDLAGYTVSSHGTAKDSRFIDNKGALTVKDTSAGETGKITFYTTTPDGSYSKENITIYNIGGTLTLLSGKIENTSNGGATYAVNNSSNAWGQNDDKETVFTMTGGTVSAPAGDAALRVYQNCAQSATPYSHNRVTISGGTILDTGIFLDNYIYQPTTSTTGEGILTTVVINEGATVNGLIDLKLRHAFNTSLTINGGTFGNSKLRVRKHTEWNSNVAEPTSPIVTINGGRFQFAASNRQAFYIGYDSTTHKFSTYAKPYHVTGGVFNVDLNDYNTIVFDEGKTGVANTDEATKDAYPYTVDLVAVAKIGDDYYDSLAAAVEAASEGDTIKLLTDVAEACVYDKDAAVTLNLNGNTISVDSGYALSVTAGELTVTSEVDEDGYATGGISGRISVSDGAALHIEGGIYDVDWSDCDIVGSISVSSVNRFYESDPSEVEAASAVFTSPVPYEYCATGFIPGAYGDIYIDGDSYYYVKEGVFLWKVTDADGKVAYTEVTPYAYDDEELWEYDWFGEHEMNRNGFTMTLLHDVSADDDDFSAYVSGLTYTVDLGGHTVNQEMRFSFECYVTITNGVVSNAEGTGVSVKYGAQVTLGDRFVVSQSVTGVYVDGDEEYAKLTVKDGAVINGTYGVVVFGSGSEYPVTEVVVEGGTITGTEYGISGNGTIEDYEDNSNTRIIVSGGTISGGEIGIYHPQAGTLTISGENTSITGATAVYAKSGTITISGGTLVSDGAAAEYEFSSSGANTTGDALVIDNCGYPGGSPVVSVTGGTFVSANAQPVASYASGAGNVQIKNFVSGGYFSQYITNAYCADGYLCTTKPTANGMYQVVPAKTVTYTLAGDGDPTGAALPSPASFAYPSGDLAEIALAVATCTSSDYTFAGWKIGGTGDAIAVLPSGTASNVTLVATWTVAQTIEVTATTNEVVAQVEIKVTDAWIEANVTNKTGSAESPTAADIQAVLNETADNGLKVWENYVLGQDPTTAVAVGAKQGDAVTSMPVSNTLTVQPVDTGFTVEYSLKQVDTNGTEIATVETKQTTDFDIDLSTVESNAYYVMTATIKTDDGATVSTVTSTNVIGVLKVESGATTTAVAVPWASYDGTNDISVADIVRTANLTPGDELKAYAPDGSGYKAWTLNAAKEWEPNITATKTDSSVAPTADDFKVKRGSAVWLTRQDTSTPIYLVGGVAESKDKVEVELEAGTTDNPSWNLVGSAGTEPVNVAEVLGDNHEDKIIVPTATVPKNYEYNTEKGEWGYWDYETVIKPSGRKTVTKVWKPASVETIPAGTGFWYLNGGESKDINL